ncbi:hypothetical protein [[Eubacterium] cellulosolvens]
MFAKARDETAVVLSCRWFASNLSKRERAAAAAEEDQVCSVVGVKEGSLLGE